MGYCRQTRDAAVTRVPRLLQMIRWIGDRGSLVGARDPHLSECATVRHREWCLRDFAAAINPHGDPTG
jgi:hypothetical protein